MTVEIVSQRSTPKQQTFLDCTAYEALFGGAAGGGKTSALLLAAAQYIHVPGYAALVLRRRFTDLMLPDGILARAKDWWCPNDDIRWSDRDKTFTFPHGSTITFGYCDNDQDRYRYQGAQVQFIGIDELTQWPETWYRYLLSRIRKAALLDVPLRARATSNPGGIGHEWVRKRFVDPRTAIGSFIPSKLEDNPYLDAASYRESLSRLDPITRKQLEDGLWIQDGGGLVYPYVGDACFIDAAPPGLRPEPGAHGVGRFLLAQDYGFSNATSWAIWGWLPHDKTAYLLRCWKERGIIPSVNAERVQALNATYHFERIVGDVGGLGKGYAEEARSRWHLPIQPAEKQNKRGYIDLFNGDMSRGAIKVVRPECQQFIEETTELPWNDDRSEEMPGFENHCCDGALYGWRATTAYLDPLPVPRTGGRAYGGLTLVSGRRGGAMGL